MSTRRNFLKTLSGMALLIPQKNAAVNPVQMRREDRPIVFQKSNVVIWDDRGQHHGRQTF